MDILRRLILKGFKSIKAADIELRPLNVLIGANGAGKSNLLSFFRLLNEMTAGRFQEHIGTGGFARSFLHFGPKVTQEIEARLEFDVEGATNTFSMNLALADPDRLVFASEILSVHAADGMNTLADPLTPSPSRETLIIEAASSGNPRAQAIMRLLNNCRVFHFHDTSRTARVRQSCYVGDNRRLLPDAGNLAAVLLRLRNEDRPAYLRIVSTIRLTAPFFDDFVLEPDGANKRDVLLNWRHAGSDEIFGPHQLSDGTLRAMCLVSLLLQPEDQMPRLIIVDEPELGLHPYALNVIAALFKKASNHTQVLISAQSATLLDSFDPDDVIVVSREGRESHFARADSAKLMEWLDEYSLGEIWEKNIMGGGPH